MGAAHKKTLRMRRLRPEEIGAFRLDMMSILARSPDPFGGAEYVVPAGPCLELARATGEAAGTRISVATVLNKLIGLAISENPIYNQIILGGSLYQLEEVHISNAFLLPGPEQALTYIVLENPHRKSLVDIQQEALGKMVAAARERAGKKSRVAAFCTRLYFRAGLYRLVSERLAFTAGFQSGLVSNVVLSNHEYLGGANFTVHKPVITPMKIPLRIHSCGAVQRPVVTGSAVTVQPVFPLTIIADHRILHGVHGYRFGKTLETIAADPQRYLG